MPGSKWIAKVFQRILILMGWKIWIWLVLVIIFSISVSDVSACISGPFAQPYYTEYFNLTLPSNLPKGIGVKLYSNSLITVSSSLAYPVYALVEATNPHEVYTRGNLTFPAGFIPGSALVGKQVLEYDSSRDTWRVARTRNDVEPYDPYFDINLFLFHFKSENIFGLDPELQPVPPTQETKLLKLMMNSEIYDVKVIKSYIPNPTYKRDVTKELRLAAEETAAQKIFDNSLIGRIRQFFNLLFPVVKTRC